MAKIKAILFDLDGTLINSEKAFCNSFIRILNDEYNAKITEEDYEKYELKENAMLLKTLTKKGIIKEDHLTIDKPIGRSSKDRKKMAVTDKNSRRAVTHISVLKRFYASNVTLVEAELETGRTHQIRVHMASLHHPLVDRKSTRLNSSHRL